MIRDKCILVCYYDKSNPQVPTYVNPQVGTTILKDFSFSQITYDSTCHEVWLNSEDIQSITDVFIPSKS